ncbi:unnamed protein product [Bursaphelenchus xylophilus]|uniref:(pine wood nematode) hypothetical protein n=1 Tax=Bursaphelenchus xylophilus TaxID=6326 RepID=A0A1I7RX51_BURXY|nr:unnamed protein product [Bursaphelenchus xylophilus]CAG9121327.1 unnamed protein product [Bursaphelenchus xylophilus]
MWMQKVFIFLASTLFLCSAQQWMLDLDFQTLPEAHSNTECCAYFQYNQRSGYCRAKIPAGVPNHHKKKFCEMAQAALYNDKLCVAHIPKATNRGKSGESSQDMA